MFFYHRANSIRTFQHFVIQVASKTRLLQLLLDLFRILKIWPLTGEFGIHKRRDVPTNCCSNQAFLHIKECLIEWQKILQENQIFQHQQQLPALENERKKGANLSKPECQRWSDKFLLYVSIVSASKCTSSMSFFSCIVSLLSLLSDAIKGNSQLCKKLEDTVTQFVLHTSNTN